MGQDKKAEKRKQREKPREVKRRIITLKEQRCNNQHQNEIREGTAYESNVGMWHSCDTEEIPAPTIAPKPENLPISKTCIHVMVDVETTSLGKN